MSLDGYVAGPNQSLENPLGEGGEQLHEWVIGLAAWRRPHGRPGGEVNASSPVFEGWVQNIGAVIRGGNMFGGEGPGEKNQGGGGGGDDPPFHVPVFVVTHHEREPLVKQGGTTFHFVTGGIASAVEEARAVAGDLDVSLAGGASIVQQCLAAGFVDEFQIHVVPLLLGGGVRLFDGDVPAPVALEAERVVASPAVTHLRFHVSR